MLVFMACPAEGLDLTVASRQIFHYSRLPEALYNHLTEPAHTALLQSMNRLCLKEQHPWFVLRTEYELSSLYCDGNQLTANKNWSASGFAPGYKKFASAADFLNAGRTNIKGQLERFDFSFSMAGFDIQIGRQPVSFGTSHFISVIDVLTPSQPGYLDRSFKPGIDALRVRTLAGITGEAELIFAAAPDNNDNAFIGRVRNTCNGFDLELTAGRFRQRNFFATGFEGERRRVTIWGELALFQRRNEEAVFGGFSNQMAFSWIAGAERSTGHDWRHGLALMHQDFGARSAGNLAEVANTLPLKQGWVHTAGSDYLLINTERKMNPLTTLNVNIIHSLVDRSSLIQPQLNISTGNESDLAIFAWFNTGKKPEKTPNSLQIHSEFGGFSNGLGLIYRVYFNN